MKLLLICLSTLLLTACGQQGDLYLPADSSTAKSSLKTQVVSRQRVDGITDE